MSPPPSALRPISRRYCIPSNCYRRNALIRAIDRVLVVAAGADDGQHAAAGGDDSLVGERGARVKDRHAGDLRRREEAGDRHARGHRDPGSPPTPGRRRPRRRSSARRADRRDRRPRRRRAAAAARRRSSGITACASGSPNRTLYSITFGPGAGHHQSRIEEPAVLGAFGAHAAQHRVDDAAHDGRLGGRVQQRARRERAHAAGVRPLGRCRRCACGPAPR